MSSEQAGYVHNTMSGSISDGDHQDNRKEWSIGWIVYCCTIMWYCHRGFLSGDVLCYIQIYKWWLLVILHHHRNFKLSIILQIISDFYGLRSFSYTCFWIQLWTLSYGFKRCIISILNNQLSYQIYSIFVVSAKNLHLLTKRG